MVANPDGVGPDLDSTLYKKPDRIRIQPLKKQDLDLTCFCQPNTFFYFDIKVNIIGML